MGLHFPWPPRGCERRRAGSGTECRFLHADSSPGASVGTRNLVSAVTWGPLSRLVMVLALPVLSPFPALCPLSAGQREVHVRTCENMRSCLGT